MKRLLAAVLCLVLVCAAAARAAEPEQALWTRSEGDGDYVTIRVPCPEGEQLSWAQTRKLCVRYADTGEPVALCSNYYRGISLCHRPGRPGGPDAGSRSGRACTVCRPYHGMGRCGILRRSAWHR